MKKRLFSGIQPTGKLHIGNYLGAIKNFVALQNKYDSFFCVVDYHAITVPQEPEELRRSITSTANVYLAAGLDPRVSTIFIQSHVSEHTELAWILNNFTHLGELNRMTQFKEKGEGQKNVSLGLFDYPVLMAADILLYDTDLVPVGQDQKQHVELTRDITSRFNNRFGKIFVIPEPYIPKVGARIMSLKDSKKKMSKSEPNPASAIFLTDGPKEIKEKIKSAVTDPAGFQNLYTIYKLFGGKKNAASYKNRYADFKTELSDTVISGLKPFQKKFFELEKNPKLTHKLLDDGARKAKTIAAAKLKEVKRKIGVC